MEHISFDFNQLSQGIPYCPIAKFQGLEVGYSANGYWTIKKGSSFFELRPEIRKDLIAWLPILEGNYNFFKNMLILNVDILDIDKDDFISTFPIEDLLKTALMSMSAYWVDLALVWVENLNNPCLFKEELKALSDDKAIPQKLRHKAKRLFLSM